MADVDRIRAALRPGELDALARTATEARDPAMRRIAASLLHVLAGAPRVVHASAPPASPAPPAPVVAPAAALADYVAHTRAAEQRAEDEAWTAWEQRTFTHLAPSA